MLEKRDKSAVVSSLAVEVGSGEGGGELGNYLVIRRPPKLHKMKNLKYYLDKH